MGATLLGPLYIAVTCVHPSASTYWNESSASKAFTVCVSVILVLHVRE